MVKNPGILIVIRTVICFLYFFLSLTFLTLAGLIVTFVCLFGLWKFQPFLLYKLAQGWALLMIFLTGCKSTVLGRENIPREGGLCFVCNHGGIFDVALLLAYTGRPFGFIAKKELLWIPFVNVWISMLGGYFIDRKNIRQGLRTINKGISRIKSGGAMLIFPEGHRSKGRGLLPFHSGSFKLATQAKAVIVPVALTGGYEVYERNLWVTPYHLRVNFGNVINTADIPLEDRKHQLSEQVYQVIKQALDEQAAS